MTSVRGRRALPLLALFASFGAGVLVDGWLRTYGPPKPVQAAAKPSQAASDQVRLTDSAKATSVKKPDTTTGTGPVIGAAPGPPPSSVAPPPSSVASGSSRTVTGTAGGMSRSRLRVPIDGISIESFKGSFSEPRGSRPHEAVDIVVPRGTPVHAVQDGTIAKLFFSQAGGTTIYEFDPDGRLCYYYAHLERYADGLREGQHVSQGEVIGYVGSSGNAPPDTPHLHFAIFELNADRKWWQGRPLDPYLVFKEKG